VSIAVTGEPDDADESGSDVSRADDGTEFVECDSHILCLANGLLAFMGANHAEAARINRKTADIELADAETHKWGAYGKADRPAPATNVRNIKPPTQS
jgi:hypothetical protein